jgi:hypothetical protein
MDIGSSHRGQASTQCLISKWPNIIPVHTLPRDSWSSKDTAREAVTPFQWKFTPKNAMIPVITIVGMHVSILSGGTVIIENIFNLPGHHGWPSGLVSR